MNSIGEQTIYNGLKMLQKKSHRKRYSQLNQYETLRPWQHEDDNYEGYIIKKKLYYPKQQKQSNHKDSIILSLFGHNPIPSEKLGYLSHHEKKPKQQLQLPSLMVTEAPMSKKDVAVFQEEHEVKRSSSLPIIQLHKKIRFSHKRNIAIGNVQQQKTGYLRNCINTQILCMDDFHSVKLKILKI